MPNVQYLDPIIGNDIENFVQITPNDLHSYVGIRSLPGTQWVQCYVSDGCMYRCKNIYCPNWTTLTDIGRNFFKVE